MSMSNGKSAGKGTAKGKAKTTSKGKTATKTTSKGNSSKSATKGAMEVFMLHDRTGSMAEIWSESVNSINVYVKELAKDKEDYRITLAVFDLHGGLQFDVLRDAVPIGEWKDFAEEEAPPRGSTPLLDSLVRLISMAEKSNPDRAVVVVMTDGYENASREVDLNTARAAVKRVEDKGWQVVFLGEDFNSFAQAGDLHVKVERRMNVARGHQAAAMRLTAEKASRYFNAGEAMSYDDADRLESGEDKVK
jgi:hypothetical protein